MIKIALKKEKFIVISNLESLIKIKKIQLKNFLNSNLEIFREVNYYIYDEVSFSGENIWKSFKVFEKYIKKNNISFNYDKTILAFISQQEDLNQQFVDLRKIGHQLKNNKIIPDIFKNEYEIFTKFCKENFREKHEPYENQIHSAFFHLKMKKSCNFSSPGTGKTTIVYSLFKWLKNKENNEVDTIFIVGPKSSLISWKNEYKECFGEEPDSIDFNSKTFARDINVIIPHNKNIIYFLNYEKINIYKKELVKFFTKYRTLLVLDEAHRIKNPEAQRFNYLFNILNNNNVRIPYQIILTGTPIPNGYENLYSYFDLTKENNLSILSKSYDELKKIKIEQKTEVNVVFDEVFPFFYTLSKKDMENFKEPNYEIISCKMENFQRDLFEKINKRIADYWKNEIDEIVFLKFYRSKLIRLMQIQTDIRMLLKPVNEIVLEAKYLNNSELDDFFEKKYNYELKEILEKNSFNSDMKDLKLDSSEIKNELERYDKSGLIPDKYKKLLQKVKELIAINEKVIIWSNWIYCIKEIEKIFLQEKIKCGLLYGAVEYNEKEKIIEDFNNIKNKKLMVLIANPASVGESISLHKACQNAIYFDINYNVTTHFQSKDRIHRFGMPKGKEQVTYYYLLSKDSWEEKIFKHIKAKEEQMINFLDKNQNLFNFKDSDFNNFIPSINDIEKTFKQEN